MERAQEHSQAKAEAWAAYRGAFADFSQSVRKVQRLIAHPNPRRDAIEAGLLELEKARVVYNRSRDAVAEQLLRSPGTRRAATLAPDATQAYAGRVRGMAELLWEVAGRPDGTAEADWYRAEEILRRAAVA